MRQGRAGTAAGGGAEPLAARPRGAGGLGRAGAGGEPRRGAEAPAGAPVPLTGRQPSGAEAGARGESRDGGAVTGGEGKGRGGEGRAMLRGGSGPALTASAPAAAAAGSPAPGPAPSPPPRLSDRRAAAGQ